jgi:hypothetical protein
VKDWAEKLNAFLKFNEKDILDNPGTVSADIAKTFAEKELSVKNSQTSFLDLEKDDWLNGFSILLP